MSDPFEIVKDSSIWQNANSFDAVDNKDPYIRIGVVKKVYLESRNGEFKYLVEVQSRNIAINVSARMMRKFGGVYNYEDYIYHGYKTDDKPDPTRDFAAKAGDAVIIAFLNGENREGIILGGFLHAARRTTLPVADGPQYIAEFNGVETTINNFGEYQLKFKAVPINAAALDNKPTKTIPAATYDTKVGGSFFKFDKTGSIEMSDVDQSGLQNMRIDKPAGTVTINSGKIQLTMTKSSEAVSLSCKTLTITAADKITGTTKEFSIDATTSAKIKSPKVAIGKDGIELLDQIFQLVDAIGKVTPISPIGPCTPLATDPQWPAVAAIQAKIKEITGTF